MKKQCLEILAAMAVKAIRQSNNTASRYWSYQPTPP
ncbi:MAG: cyclic lactone autoinducer peptide [Tissierellaceae bacterium]|jgi:cyclic lactone autoinducer peptide|nr:cyclic lactone autoinducer peptide [Tissierellaceae bacterium]